AGTVMQFTKAIQPAGAVGEPGMQPVPTAGLARQAALPASAVTARVQFRGFAVMARVGAGMPESGPCLPVAAGFLRAGGRVTGARSARAAAPQAPLTRSSGSGSCQAGGGREPGVGCGSAVQAGGLSVRGDQPWRAEGGARSSQPYLGPRGFWVLPRRHDD